MGASSFNLSNIMLQDFTAEGNSSGSGVLSSVPSALCRWTEEARVLDGDSMHDLMSCKF